MAQALVAAPPTRHELVEASLETCMATDRGTCGSVRSAAFQRCKNVQTILKWRQCERFPILCRSGAAVRLLPGSCTVPARFASCPATGSCPAPARFTAWFLPGSCPAAGSCPVRYLPDGRAGSASVGRRSGSSCAGAGQQNRPCTTLWCCTTLHLVRALPTVRGVGFTYYDRINMFHVRCGRCGENHNPKSSPPHNPTNPLHLTPVRIQNLSNRGSGAQPLSTR